MRLLLRPIDMWPGELTRHRKSSPFRSTYKDTLVLLDRELAELGVAEAVIQLAIREEDLRLDGELRANARPETHPGVILSFKSKKLGALSYPCDTFDGNSWCRPAQIGWQVNLRAIALGLEALRKVERYGIAARGQQYVGWKALDAGTPMPAAAQMTVEDAARYIARHSNPPDLGDKDWELLLEDPSLVDVLYREAAKRLHPDAGGTTVEFQRLAEAKQVVDDYGRTP